ncbi:centromere-associated protein E isoform X2 [Xiphophorus couchianus]|uniref:centromere-associated protein E isoform X2 n=1 Tax=Xiphophorus couchianus TaxID=32473 RepID=UPI001015E091|nr:centromere-associated protein E isoform X2 [Xiphophorus couchianus]
MLFSRPSSYSLKFPGEEMAESAVKVCVRVRPVAEREKNAASEKPVQLFWENDKKSIRQIDDGNSSKCFTFDRVFGAEESTSQLYQDIAKPLVVSTVAGYNGTIFAYGQTSSGKTFTMMGSDRNRGVIPLAVDDVFQTIKTFPNKEFLLRVSYMEIYNETVTDLLVDSWKRKPLEIRETMNKTVYVADLTEELVTTSSQALAWIRKGEKNRHYGKTKMNQRSSRSHTIFRMILESRERSDPASGENADGAIIVSHLNLVDLAGSERASQTGTEGTRFKEGCNINLSLFILGQVIKKLTDENQKGFTSYRDSKLTRILQNSLGGNAKTVIISTITPVSLEETLGTLQFASTAKKMKNDPHVTEVSDDGALLKRYRNEIVDLKRRLNEVSSVTQTTVTEKEVLSQLLQEKDQLQREQEDRIRNLTKLLVTSSNLVSVPKMPKRRVTWGGKMLHGSQPACDDDGIANMNVTFSRKRRANRFCSGDLVEADEDFYPHWEIPEEPSEEMEMSQSSLTVRSFGDSDLASPDQRCALLEKLSNLEHQLETERQQREEAVRQAETLDCRVAELQVQLQTLLKEEAAEKKQSEERLANLEAQLRNETQQKLDASLQVQAAEQKVAELEEVLQTEAQQKREATLTSSSLEVKVSELERQLEEKRQSESEQMRKGFAESVQLCETLASEKEAVTAERDNLKQELGMFLEHTQSLEKENAALHQELKEKKDLEEFKSLELKFMAEQESELQKEISSLKKAIELSEHQRRQPEMTLTASKENLEPELTGPVLHMAVESHPEKHQNVSYDDVELSALDDTLPQNLLGSVKVESGVISLQEELALCGEAEEALREQQQEEQASLQTPGDQNGDLTGELQDVNKTTDDLQSGLAAQETELKQQCADLTQQLDALQAEQRQSVLDRSRLLVSLEEKDAELKQTIEALQGVEAEREALLLERRVQSSAEDGNAATDVLLRSVQEELREEKQRHSDMKTAFLEKESELKEHMLRLTQELQDGGRSSTEEVERLLTAVASLTAERDQLKQDLQENVELMIENQDELRSVLEKNHEQAKQIKLLKSGNVCKQDGGPTETDTQLEEAQGSMTALSEELRHTQAEKDGLLSQSAATQTTEELEELRGRLAALTEEREELLHTAERLRGEKEELRAQLEVKTHMMQCEIQQQQLLSEANPLKDKQIQQLEELERLRSVLQEKEKLTLEKQEELQVLKESRERMEEDMMELKSQLVEMQSSSCNTHKQFAEKLECVKAEREVLLAQRDAVSQRFEEELEKLQSSLDTVGQEREELQEELRQKQEAEMQLQRRTEMLEAEVRELNAFVQNVTEQKRQQEQQLQQLGQKASSTEELLKALQYDLRQQRNVNSELKKASEEEKRSLEQKITELCNNLESVEAERDFHLSDKEENLQKHKEEMEKLQLSVTALSQKSVLLQEEKEQLEAQLQHNINMASAFQEKITQQELLMSQKQTEKDEQEATFQQKLQNLQKELQLQRERRAQSEAQRDASQQLLNEANVSLSALRQQLNNLEQKPNALWETLSHLQDSADHLDATFGKFQQFREMCTKTASETLENVLKVQSFLKLSDLKDLPKSRLAVFGDVFELGFQTCSSFTKTLEQLTVHPRVYMKTFELVVNIDLAVFEERRLQDLLMSRVGAPKFSVNIEDFHSRWNQRLSKLLDKRRLYQQQMESILERLWANLTSYIAVRQAEVQERVKFNESIEAASSPPVISELERILGQEAERRRLVVQNGTMPLQVISDELSKILAELMQMDKRRDGQLREERRKTSSLLQQLEGTPAIPNLSSVQDYQQLQQAAGELTVLQEQLEEAKAEAKNMGSNHKRTTQLLQTELLDTKVLVKEKENTILTLKVKLEESENASLSAAQLKNFQSKLREEEVKLASITQEHQQEMEKMKMVLSVKEESLRKLKQDLRSQHQGEESFLTGKELHARLTNPRGTMIQSSILLEKTKLEEEVKQLLLRITELESLVSCQQEETTKWKNRAISLKGKSKAEQDRMTSPCTPKKRALCPTSDSTLLFSPTKKSYLPPKRALDSPRKPLVSAASLLDSPKSSFFNAGEGSELLTRNYPTQFFDNSNLGIKPDEPAAEKPDFWNDGNCKTQ